MASRKVGYQFRTFAILAILGFGWAGAAEAEGVPERCTKCHTEKVIVEKVAKMPAEDRLKRLDGFLAKHFAPNADERKAIAEALATKAGAPR